MNKVHVPASSNRPADQGAHLELFAQESGGMWVRITVTGATGRTRSTSVIVSPENTAAVHEWLNAYRGTAS